jgi:hypothetical protein
MTEIVLYNAAKKLSAGESLRRADPSGSEDQSNLLAVAVRDIGYAFLHKSGAMLSTMFGTGTASI